MAGTLKEQFFPANDRDMFQIQVFMPSHASIAETQRVVEAVREQLESYDWILDNHWFLGDPAPRVYYTMGSQAAA